MKISFQSLILLTLTPLLLTTFFKCVIGPIKKVEFIDNRIKLIYRNPSLITDTNFKKDYCKRGICLIMFTDIKLAIVYFFQVRGRYFIKLGFSNPAGVSKSYQPIEFVLGFRKDIMTYLSSIALILYRDTHIYVSFMIPIEINRDEEQYRLKLTQDRIYLALPAHEKLNYQQLINRKKLKKLLKDALNVDLKQLNLNVVHDSVIEKVKLALIYNKLKHYIPISKGIGGSPSSNPTDYDLRQNRKIQEKKSTKTSLIDWVKRIELVNAHKKLAELNSKTELDEILNFIEISGREAGDGLKFFDTNALEKLDLNPVEDVENFKISNYFLYELVIKFKGVTSLTTQLYLTDPEARLLQNIISIIEIKEENMEAHTKRKN
jgi:hypothetical protein